ncbi:MAG: extracellular solute-binding protein family 1 [Paenibacillus sp.]|jgi:multiple sugar transport system substrate-binding protein|nr:extracellular solute-binding protein family 1 [Paenibacillus sp.]
MKTRLSIAMLATAAAVSLVSGCSGGGGEGPKAASEEHKPITLSVYQYSAFLTDEEFQNFMVNPVKKKYPYMTLELVRSGKGTTPEELVAAGGMPDIIYTGSSGSTKMIELNAVKDMTPLLKPHNIDLGKFDSGAVEALKQYSPSGQLMALPLAVNFSVLLYNKDIFDMTGVAYPKDGLRWEDAFELTKRLTRMSNGIQYKGLDIDGGVQRLGEQLSLPVVDSKTLKAAINTDGWKKAIDLFVRLKSVPGNNDGKAAIASFEQDRNLAMFGGLSARIGELEQLHKQGNPLNWDMATMPTFPETPKNAFAANQFLLMLSSTSKNADEAMRLISFFIDEDVQAIVNKNGRLSGLKDKKLQQLFGEELISLKGKNKEAITKTNPAPLPPITVYDGLARTQMSSAADEVLTQKNDMNTALRNAEEKANQLIEEEKRKK